MKHRPFTSIIIKFLNFLTLLIITFTFEHFTIEITKRFNTFTCVSSAAYN